MIPCVLYEDEHLLVVNKPSGMNTHRASPYTSEGIYEWLKGIKSSWENLAILHRLDKETSGVLIFGKTSLANRSLSDQFAKHKIKKTYLLLTDFEVPFESKVIRSSIVRVRDHYEAGQIPSPKRFHSREFTRPVHPVDLAETQFEVLERANGCTLLQAHPLTGRTHQIRVHAAWAGFPILGDTLYGGTPTGRICLQAFRLELIHPSTGEGMTFEVPQVFSVQSIPGIVPVALALRDAFLNRLEISETSETNIWRAFHSTADGYPGVYVDFFNGRLLVQTESSTLSGDARSLAKAIAAETNAQSIWHKTLLHQPGKTGSQEVSPEYCWGKQTMPATPEFMGNENGVKYKLSFKSGYSIGIFMDQRENRRRILSNLIAPGFYLKPTQNKLQAAKRQPPPTDNMRPEMLNAFAYTCAFSVCGALAGFRVTSLDLSRKYLDWGAENMRLNGIDPTQHDFIYGDVFSWCRRLLKKKCTYDCIILDPPTFSRSKESGTFKAERDMGRLVEEWLPLLKSGGVMLISTNCATLSPTDFETMVLDSIARSGKQYMQKFFVTQPFDFPACSEEKAYLKTLWISIL